ncbi:PilZ domain-containing protein [Amphritea balenae]|uniref:PilZ domain-containing protein n=1 Tax=Amphritea balenae TaxID=452629 RepID=UPI001475E2A3|nr:PilZ domain-containing protein [Amphritea balenae]GGK78971.1 hypothetical protein GCM10007941_31520 [Amphritea balenae]
MLSDNRLHPRVATDISVKVGIPGDNSGARIIDISLGGITISGSDELAQVLTLDQENPSVIREHVISFSLPSSEFSEVCRLVNIRRLSQSKFEFGMKFVDLNSRDVASISDYINNHVL